MKSNSKFSMTIPASPRDSMATFRDPKYTITTSLNDRAIYIKIANNISYMRYEGNFDTTSFKLPFDIKEIYQFVNKCFAYKSDPEYEDGY